MNRGKKLVGMVERKSNTTPKNCVLIKHRKNEKYVENWSNTRNGIEVDLNRLNGVDIDDFIIEFADNHKTKNNIEESDNMLENNSLNLVHEQTVDNIVILDTENVKENDDDNQDVSSSSVSDIGRGAKQKIESKKIKSCRFGIHGLFTK